MFSTKIKAFEKDNKINFDLGENIINRRHYAATDATIEDINSDEKEIDRYYDMIMEGKGDKIFILATLQDCQKRYKDFISCLQRDFDNLLDNIKDNSLPFVVRQCLSQKIVPPPIILQLEPNKDFIPECWEIIEAKPDKKLYAAKWEDESYNKNAKKILGKKAMPWINLRPFLCSIIDVTNLGEKAEELVNNKLNPLLERLTGEITPPKADVISPVSVANEVPSSPGTKEVPVASIIKETSPVTPKKIPVDVNDFSKKPYWKKLASAFFYFPDFEKEFPILLKKDVIEEEEGEYSDRIRWKRSNGALAFYFSSRAKGHPNWKLLEEVFTDKYGRPCDGKTSTWSPQLNRSPTHDAEDVFKLLKNK